MHRLITHRLIPALVCFLLCISNTQAQTQQAIGYGGISDFVKHDQSTLPSLTSSAGAEFGSAIVDIGDIDGDDVDDLVVGGHLRNVRGAGTVGSIYILRMTTENTVKGISEITHGDGDIQLITNDRFGTSLANIGDFDGDGINELAVGTGGGPRGVMYILHLNASGGLKHSSTIDFNDINNILGNDDLDDGDRFGASIANMGDIDGDGIIDLAVGAFLDDERFGSVHILFMNNTGNSPTLKAAAKIDTSGLTALNDFFGISVANIGDLNGDRINDLAVGAFLNNGTYGTNQGAVHVFLLNRDGSINPDSFEILDTGASNIFDLNSGDQAGRAIANLGDLNGDGINDIAVGAIGVDPGTTGAVFTIFMNRMKDQITAADIPRITHNSLPDLNLATDDRFGLSVANIGDRNEDGINDIAVGAASENGIGSFYILHMDAETVITDVTATTDGSHNMGTIIDIQIIFSEAVDVAGIPTLTLEPGGRDAEAIYTSGSGSNILTFEYTIVDGNSVTDLDYVSTMSLTLDGGTINAATTPKQAVSLTLPEPGSRGSLSSNKNLSINSPAIGNTAPTGPTQNLDQELTVNTPFTYTIPAGAFADTENDPLRYTSSNLPAWLNLDSDTGTFSGTPPTAGNHTISLTISDGTLSTTADINIRVNPAPTLPTIDDKNYSLSQPISSIVLPEAAEGTGTFIYTLSPADLPGNLTFDANTRTISGGTAPATESTGQYTYTAEDENGALAAQTFTITVKAPPTLNSISDKIYLFGNRINEQLPAATEGTGPFTYELSPSSLPDGLMFDVGTRIISGIPTKAGQHIEYTYTATDSSLPVANEVSTNFSITIVAEAISSLLAKWNGHIFDIVKHDQSGVINIPADTKFGASIVNIGDIDGDDIDDLVVGGSAQTVTGRGVETGSIYILMMNADNTVKAFSQIGHGTGGIQLIGKGNFGVSMANIGDFDGDRINELAVGTRTDKIYILHLNPNGTLKSFSTLDFNDVNNILGDNGLDNTNEFSGSIANLGDIDGDGIIDLAVGAHLDDETGSVHILFMERMGNSPVLKAAAKIDTATLNLSTGDAFGISAANIGDFDGDGINDLAVGAPGNDGDYGNNQGAVHVLLLNRDGSIKPDVFEIFDTGTNNIFDLNDGDQAGGAIANLGDLNGDGINDLVVGAPRVDPPPDAGAVFTVLMKKTKAELITADDNVKITHNFPSDLTLAQGDSFGGSIANIGDRNGDGINDIAVGASGTDSNTGAFYILHMDAETVITAVTAATADGRYNTTDVINIQVIFSEPVEVDTSGGTPSLTLNTGGAAVYTSGSGSDTLTFAYTVAAGTTADLDYVDTASLTPNDAISAAATPKQTALLTLPAPGSRGSLSSNKNIAINTLATENRPPMGPTPLLQNQVLTVGALFEYPIAGSFSDPENDALTYTPLSTTPLPAGLSLDSITGIISGAPTTMQNATDHTITVSDGELSTTANINITVNAAPTLATIEEKNYSLGETITSITLPTATGGTAPFIYTLSPALPGGLTFTGRTIAGTAPTATEHTGQYTYTAEDANGALVAAQPFTITIKAAPTLNSISDKIYLIGDTVNEQLPAATGGTGSFTYSLSPAPPDGLELDGDTGILSGETRFRQRIEYTYTATDSSLPEPKTVSTNFFIIIASRPFPAKWNGYISNVFPFPHSHYVNQSAFGSSVADMGDIDGDGVDDIAVGASGLTLFIGASTNHIGGVYILLMNANGTEKSRTRISGDMGIQLVGLNRFGSSVANIGDFDGDGINELAVGTNANRIYILHLTRQGELERFSTLDFNDINAILGNGGLDDNDLFGVSVANLGDIDGDGIIDLAVGAGLDDGGQGSVHILFMDKTETGPTLKAVSKINTNGLGLTADDRFGVSVAGIGDLNEDGINDLAVGAFRNMGSYGADQGAVHILLLNRDGSRQGGFEILDTGNPVDNPFGLNSGDRAGRSIANLGDLNGDGINDIAVGAIGVNSNAGAVFTVFMDKMKNEITADDIFRITHPGLTLSDNDQFGISVANIGDRNGDGINDIAVGVPNFGSSDHGRLYILYMDAETVIRNVTATADDGRYDTGNMLNIQVIFSEAVNVDGTPILTLETGDPDTEAIYASGSGSNTLTFEYTVAGTDIAEDLDYVSTMSLTLDGGTIVATEAPNSSASLTLPAPGSRGSLSSNKNLAINTAAIPNTAPMASTTIQIEDLELTADTSFTYTIPAGTFTDAENDPLAYTSSTLPDWLSLDPITGTFSGAPPTEQGPTLYPFTILDSEDETTANISITVHSAPTLPTISNISYTPGDTISIPLPAATGGTGDITYTLSPVLPNYLQFNPDRSPITITNIAATTSHRGQYTYTAEDENGVLAAQTFSINIVETQYGGISNIVRHEIGVLGARFGRSITNMGDIDKNGTDDLAVGASGLSLDGVNDAGGVYILLMNDDNTFDSKRISVNSAGLQLTADNQFGYSLANIGDFDGDGIDELAVGTLAGSIYILHLNNTGELDHFSRIGFENINMILENDDLESGNRFGVSIANLGDIDGDGINDLAVGAHQDDSRKGSVHILFMNKTETGPRLKAVSKINSLSTNTDRFGNSVAGIGDLNQDGINDLAVGAFRNNGDRGAVHILLLNRNGSIKQGGFEVFDTSGRNIFDLNAGNRAGRSIANLGDLNGDGINDIAVGVPIDSKIFTILMRRARTQITADDIFRIDSNSHASLGVFPNHQFGDSIANIGDRNGDGINDIAVGAPGTYTTGSNAGTFYILYMNPIITVNNVTAAEANGRYGTGTGDISNVINIQVIFSEAVDVDTSGGTPALFLETGPAGPSSATYTTGSGSDTLTFEYTVANDDSAKDLDYVSTMSLTLNGGIINSTATSGQRALLTLPVPGSRGSLSANKNLAINEVAPDNTAPMQKMPIPDQTLTVDTPFTYTIPAEAFNDIDNDPLTYTSSALPDWLNLDSTGIFSGTPPANAQGSAQYTITISDGTASPIEANIRITVNAELTFLPPAINDRNYSPGDQIRIVLPPAIGGTTPTYTLSPVLPDELTFDDTERTITGTRTEEHTGQYTYTAEDENGALAAQTFTLTIRPLQALNSISDKIYLVGNRVNEQLPAAIGGTGPISYTLSLEELPDGLTFSTTTRTISGIPEKNGNTEYIYTATDSSSPTVSVSTNFSIIIIAETISSRLAKGTGYISDIIKYDQPTLSGIGINIRSNSQFGSSVINLGDINGDKVDDLAVGASGDNSGGLNRGAVYILLMNADGTIASRTLIKNDTPPAVGSGCADNIELIDSSSFGVSLANIGDFDGDGRNELAVGTLVGRIYILHLNASGQLNCFSEIDVNDVNNILGTDNLVRDDRFGISIANLGDIDGDGIIDLAVGAHRDDGQGSVHILFMNKTETGRPILKAVAKIDTTDLDVTGGDQFGISVANIGDFDQDGINDLAVGAFRNTGSYGTDQGAVHILLLNRDGSIKPDDDFEIFDTAGNIFNLNLGDNTGRSITNLGDLNGDGINDIAVGAVGVDSPPNDNTGAVFTIFMDEEKDQITADDIFRITHNTPSALILITDDQFGISIANIGDRNEDGINDIAVGATGTNPSNTGALYILYMDAETVITAVTAEEEDGNYTTGSPPINIQVIFSEPVDVDTTGGTPTLTLETRDPPDPDPKATYASGSGSNILTFDYIVASTDTATDLDYVSTASLTLNGGTIVATEAPNSTANLTLPAPRSRGSLSSNKNLAINEDVIVNTPPTEPAQLPPLELTAGTLFTYPIPEGTFRDAQYDPLTYSSSNLPEWLSLNPAGTFSGTPTTKQDTTQYAYTVSDGKDETTANIRIIVNPAPTLPIIRDKTYSPGQSISLELPEADGGTGTIAYTLSPVLPDSLMFNSDERTITGTAPAEQTTTYTYTAEDKNGALATQTFRINTLKTQHGGVLSNIIKNDQSTLSGFGIDIPAATKFGSSVINLGDIDGNGTDDLAVGAPEDGKNLSLNQGAVYILLMNADSTTAVHTVIRNDTSATGSDCAAGNIALNINSFFGVSLANIGDFDGDGINELAVGTLAGIYILHLNKSGQLNCFSTITYANVNDILGNEDSEEDLENDDRFGVSIANLGDIDGDGIIDLAVGAFRDDTDRGSVHILFMNETDNTLTLKAAIKINTDSLDLTDGDRFGFSVAGIGDLNQDGINDLAVGAPENTGDYGTDQGAVHILLLNRDGSIKPGNFEIFETAVNIFNLIPGDGVGRSISNLGDLNGDGINDIAVGAPLGADSGTTFNTGAVFIIFMRRAKDQFIADDFFRIDGTLPNLTLSDGDEFGISVANIDDRNGDGINDIAIGAPGTDGDTGALYILNMDIITVVREVTSLDANGMYITDSTINIQVRFSEAVDVDTEDGTPTLTLKTGDPDAEASYAGGTGTDTLIFEYIVAGTDRATDLDYVSTASLTLNGGTINATEEPSNSALLTLPEPNSRGSLSSNKNLYINTAVITNRRPTGGPIPEQILTVGTLFTYTIPAGTFSDADYDALIYTPISESEFPDWLSLDPDTGTFSGAPTTTQPTSGYSIFISDGKILIRAIIDITVNEAPTLPLISDRTYSPDHPISLELPEANGGTGPFRYTLSPKLPDDLTFNPSNRMITSTTQTERMGQYTYTAEDKNGALAAQTFTITIEALQALDSISDEIYSIGDTVNKQLPATTGGTGPISYTLSPEELPDGLTFSATTRMISGMPSKTGQGNEYTYTATDSSVPQNTVSTKFSITIVAETISSSLAKWNGHISNVIKYDRSNLSSIEMNSRFGGAVTNMGDIDGNEVDDLAVGASEHGPNTGAVHILLMNANDTIKSHTVIRNGTSTMDSDCAAGNIALADNNYFGTSLANIGDFDNDGRNELAVGVLNNGIRILHLTENGELDCFSTITINDINSILGMNSLDNDDGFGVSLANLGDIDGDGIIDLAVGAHRDDEQGEERGSVHILFMDEIGNSPALKAAIKIDTSGLGLANNDQFGISVASIGDFNQDEDEINDLAVGAIGNDLLGGNNQGAVHVLLLNRDGSIKSGGFEIFDTNGNIFDLKLNDQAGRAIANLGDLNGDGINDIAAGVFAFDVTPSNDNRGAVFTIFMERAQNQITADDLSIITHNTHLGLTLFDQDLFGTSIANIGDRNGDGINDIAVGATGAAPGTTGALYILYMDAEAVIIAVTATADDGNYTTSSPPINIQVIFSEKVDVTGIPSLTLKTGDPDAEAMYRSGSGSNILTFEYTVAAGDEAQDLDYASTDSLRLNNGTIVAAEAPNSSAVLTLPEPNSRGSLSSNKNIAINDSDSPALTNTVPMASATIQIEDLELTVGMSFTYPIPAGAFTDDENDPLTYTSSALPDWLSLDPITGIFSGTPTTAEDISHEYTVSDGEFSITPNPNIRIIVNAAPTLPTIRDESHTPETQISINLPAVTAGTGTAPITYTLSPAVLPGSLEFTVNAMARMIAGMTPALPEAVTEQTRRYTYTAEDANGALVAQTFNLSVALVLDLNLRIKVFLEGAQ